LSKLTKVGAGPHLFLYIPCLGYSNQSECSICGI